MSTDDPPARPDVVQALSDTLYGNPGDIHGYHDLVDTLSATGTEQTQARQVVKAGFDWKLDTWKRQSEALLILIFSGPTADAGYAEQMASLTPEAVIRLGELYDALPEAARAEYDRQHGGP